MRYLTCFLSILCIAVVLLREPRAADKPKRVPWTTSKLTGTPEPPPPYQTELAFPKLKFTRPVTMARAPGSPRLFVAEVGGKIFSLPDDPACETPDLFLDAGKLPGHYRTYGLAFHPDFARNRLAYVCYVAKPGDAKGSKVSRFKVSDADPPVADPASEVVLIDWPSGGHNGGCLQFGPDGYLYISTGDGSNPSPPDALNTGQDISDLLASILRIDVDHPDSGKAYGIPADNPFIKQANARPEVWAYGLRNPWKMTFDPANGALWVGDVGWEMWELVYRAERGGNYGWSVVEGRQPVKPESARGPTPIIPPVVDHDHTEARSLTGGRVYHGQRLKELAGAYIYGDYVTGKIWGLRADGQKVVSLKELAHSALEIIDFGEGTDGELYVLDYGGGGIHRLVPNPAPQANANFPRQLSDTGLFASLRDLTPAAGVIPYRINAEPWADHATADRLLAVPQLGTLGVHDTQNLQTGIVKGAWSYPNDTVFAKTLTLEGRRLETQVLHQDRGTWRAYTYVWNDAQTDAVLADADGFDRAFPAKGEAGGQQTWHFASRTECLVCHTTRAGSILGFNLEQLNRGVHGGNQLAILDDLGLLERGLPAQAPRLPDPHDARVSLDERARAYLHANCAHCHRRGGGGTAPFELVYGMDLKKMPFFGARPTQGTFDIHSPETVSPGDPYRSVLFYRLAKLGPGRMPYAGSGVIDTQGLQLIRDWIDQLPRTGDRPTAVTTEQRDALTTLRNRADAAAIDRLLASTSGALYLLVAVDELPAAARDQAVATALKHPAGPVRDLFERFIPADQRVQRLGSVVKLAKLLALPGDGERGRQLWFKSAGVQCRNCHRIGGEGQEVGPDLSQIGKKLERGQILENILEPSKVIEPAYVTHVAETTRGAVVSGLLIKKSATEVVLKDAQGKTITIPMNEIDSLVPQPKSLMPELLLRELTAQEAADLLAFLAGLK